MTHTLIIISIVLMITMLTIYIRMIIRFSKNKIADIRKTMRKHYFVRPVIKQKKQEQK